MVISEGLIQFIWSKKAIDPKPLASVQGQTIEISEYGKLNLSSGPDFLYAQVFIDQVLWVGHIEIHVRTSDWVKHRHSNDRAYDNVILHVVYEHDEEVNHIPILELKSLVNPNMLDKYAVLMDSIDHIPCGHAISSFPPDKFQVWYHGLIIDRMAMKAEAIRTMMAYSTKDYETLMYQLIGKYYGATQNMDCFLTLTEKLNWKIIQKNKDDLALIESLIIGTAGFLEATLDDDYYEILKKNYTHLQKKYSIISMKRFEWRNFGMHAAGSPVLRLAQFSAFMFHSTLIFDRCLDQPSIHELRHMLHSEVSPYWTQHFFLGVESSNRRSPHATSAFKDRIIINAIIPVLWIYGDDIQNDNIKEYCLDLMESIKSEQHSITQQWKKVGIKSKSALESQALLHLKQQYCDARHCLSCQIGNHILTSIK